MCRGDLFFFAMSLFCSLIASHLFIRQDKYVSIRESVRDAMQNLEMSARSSFEIELFISEPQTVSLADSEMEKLKVIIPSIALWAQVL